jgi:hypothetical protein
MKEVSLAHATEVHRGYAQSAARAFSAEASDLGFAPGQWPLEIANGSLLLRRAGAGMNRDGEVVSVRYRDDERTLELEVFND